MPWITDYGQRTNEKQRNVTSCLLYDSISFLWKHIESNIFHLLVILWNEVRLQFELGNRTRTDFATYINTHLYFQCAEFWRSWLYIVLLYLDKHFCFNALFSWGGLGQLVLETTKEDGNCFILTVTPLFSEGAFYCAIYNHVFI